MGVFNWLRRSAREAILGGVQDAFEQLKAQNPQYADVPAIDDAPAVADKPKGKKKAGDE